jgi:hypothetical protein
VTTKLTRVIVAIVSIAGASLIALEWLAGRPADWTIWALAILGALAPIFAPYLFSKES